MVGGPDRSDNDGPLSGFGLDAGDDSWIGLLREAEQPLVMGCSGRYELLSEVSRGGQGIVYRARDVRNGRIVAAKRLVAGSLASLSSRRRFERELKTAAALDHPNIVQVFGLDGGGGAQPLLTMQWIDGTPVTGVQRGHTIWLDSSSDGRSRCRDISKRPKREILLICTRARSICRASRSRFSTLR